MGLMRSKTKEKLVKYRLRVGKPIIDRLKSVVITVLIVMPFLLMDGNTCLIKEIIGIPCPGCGMTRAYISLMHFDIKVAFYYHPLFVLPAIIAFILLFKSNKHIAKIYKNEAVWMGMLIMVVGVWIVRMIVLFPNRAPMDINRNALLFKLLSIIFRK